MNMNQPNQSMDIMTVMMKIMMTILVNDRLQSAMIMIIKTNHNQLVGRLLLRVAEFGVEGGGVELPYGGGSLSLSPSPPLPTSLSSSSPSSSEKL